MIAEKLVSEKDADAVYKEYLLDSFCNGVLSGDIDVDKIGTALDEIGRDYGLRDENTQNMLMAAEDGLIEKKDWMRAAYLWKYLRLLIGDKEELLTQVKAILANMGTDNMDVRKDMLRLACEGQSVDDRKELYDEWLSIAEDSLNQYNYKEALDILEKIKNYEPSNMLLEEAKIEAWALSKCTPFIEWCQIYCGIDSNAPSLGSLKNPQSYVSEDNLFLVERRMGGNIYEAWGENGRFDLYQPSGPNIDGWEKIKTALDYGIVYENVDYDRLEGALKDYDAVILPE